MLRETIGDHGIDADGQLLADAVEKVPSTHFREPSRIGLAPYLASKALFLGGFLTADFLISICSREKVEFFNRIGRYLPVATSSYGSFAAAS